MKPFFLFLFFTLNLFARPIETFYGVVEVSEPVLLELIDSQPFQRLKKVHQYGVSYYVDFTEEFDRYSHSLGVFHLLRKNKRPLNEQIAGILHDISHTAFSHVGDFAYNKEYKETDYQNTIHENFLELSGISAILKKYKIDPKEILPTCKNAPALEQNRPNASADRLDYSIQGAFHQNYLTKKEAIELFNDCIYENDVWVATKSDLMSKIIRFTLFMTENCFGSPQNHLQSKWLATAILKGIETNLISHDEFHYGTDDAIWEKLSNSKDPFIENQIEMIQNVHSQFTLVDPIKCKPDIEITTKFWGFDPWIKQNNHLVRLTSIDPSLSKEYHEVKDRIAKGFSIKLHPHKNASKKCA